MRSVPNDPKHSFDGRVGESRRMSKPKISCKRLPKDVGIKVPRRIVDERGELVVLHPEGTVYNPIYFDLQPGVGSYRGGHFHRRKIEIFYVISGSGRVQHLDLETRLRGTLAVSQGDMVTVEPGCAHRLEATEPCRVVEFSAVDVDVEEDTVRYDFDSASSSEGTSEH
jgi:mannose-6-phosphate isomerase-like protein (cupin superfamily)